MKFTNIEKYHFKSDNIIGFLSDLSHFNSKNDQIKLHEETIVKNEIQAGVDVITFEPIVLSLYPDIILDDVSESFETEKLILLDGHHRWKYANRLNLIDKLKCILVNFKDVKIESYLFNINLDTDEFLNFLHDEVIVISEEVKTWLENHTKKLNPHVINYWISLKEFSAVSYNTPLNIGFLGRLNKNKGIEDLVDSLNDINLDFYLVIGGFGSQEYINYLKQKMNKNLRNRSSFLGYVEDQSKFFEGIDLFVFPSYSEGLGLVLLEAMSYQKICITRNVEPMNQFINDENGYLFNNNEELKNCVMQASNDITNESIFNKKIENTKKALERYDIKNVFPKILEVYNL